MLQHRARALAEEFNLPAGEADKIAIQAAAVLATVRLLDDVPLDRAEPAATYHFVAAPNPRRSES